MIQKISYLIILTCLFFTSCKKDNTPVNPCNGVNITASISQNNPTTGQSNGTIIVSPSPVGTYTYSLNNGAFQSSGNFAGLAVGTYTILIKNVNGCTSQPYSVTLSTDPCSNNNISFTTAVTGVIPCGTPDGMITVNASGSTGFTYNINGGAFQTGNSFSNLATATYAVGVKDANGCTKYQNVNVGNRARGTKYELVRLLIIAKCASCHLNGSSSGGVNYDNECNIISGWDRINQRCVVIGDMPQGNSLTQTQKDQITAWVNAGHRYTD